MAEQNVGECDEAGSGGRAVESIRSRDAEASEEARGKAEGRRAAFKPA